MTGMIIYLLKRLSNAEFEQMQACVIVAPTPQDARNLASAEEPKRPADWLTPGKTVCEPIGRGTTNIPQVILTDINWG